MADIRKFPLGSGDDTAAGRRLSIGFAIAAVVFSVIVAAVTGTWVTAQTAGASGARIDNLTTVMQRDHDEQTRHIDQLMSLIGSVGNQAAIQGAQIEALRQAITQERGERLDYEQRHQK
jgi:hypothetical protein